MVYLLGVIALLLAAQTVIGFLMLRRKQVVNIDLPAPPTVHHQASLHKEYRECNECHLIVARYDERGVCANCVSEGK